MTLKFCFARIAYSCEVLGAVGWALAHGDGGIFEYHSIEKMNNLPASFRPSSMNDE
jgi:hypothetical protein